ncbi:MipA/OmpV family protein [Gilvimarinus sp. SDUM040013]|uniref:MipA/OmpV family protein n=1 Tax=Gilvimarinus gilvus TaxID=3058038 RepID=A0ABU4RZ89_9GAMM|nr:MipA/OmpV family protein [Gilvimarinus sp. SDUM040013]MDO3387631.1 MipA/OmpV family protein [Gilvimarinus sp. SDUM040013]MDX6848928.1 MipA/OmpV family protein [Gilvimarinus sp. SDUM040013]
MWRYIFAGSLLGLALTTHAGTPDGWQVEVGGGGASFQAPWQGVDLEHMPLPYISARYGRWGFGVGEGLVQYSLLQSPVDISVGLGYRDETYQSNFALSDYDSDDPVFNGYESAKGEVTARLQFDYGYLQLRLVQDIQGRSDGATALLRTDIPLYRHTSGWQVSGRIGAYWLQDKYATHVFGVMPDNADERVSRFEYAADSAINYFTGLQVYVPVQQRHSVRGFARYEILDDEITNSPLVGRDYRAQVGIMYVVNL